MIQKVSAGGVIINEFNEAVLVFTDTLSWQFPKGGLEIDEDYLATALREIEEETSLTDIALHYKLPVYSRISHIDSNVSREIHYYLFTTNKQILTPTCEITACEWVAFENIEEKLTYKEDKEFFKKIKNKILDLHSK